MEIKSDNNRKRTDIIYRYMSQFGKNKVYYI